MSEHLTLIKAIQLKATQIKVIQLKAMQLKAMQPNETLRNAFLNSPVRSQPFPTRPSIMLKALSISLFSTAAAILPATVQAASLSFGEPATVALFRGAGGLLGSSSSSSSDSTGIDNLARRINSDLSDYALTTRVFDSYEGNVFNFDEVGSDRGSNFLNQQSPTQTTGLIGYSAGGLSAIRTAQKQTPKPIDLLVQVESYEPLTGRSNEDEVLPNNVQTGINYYQNRNRFNVFRRGFDPTDLQGATNVQGSQNINVEELFGDRSITHRSIINNSRLQERIVNNVRDSLLRDRSFDRSGQLRLGEGASTTNNLLRLTPRDNATASVRLAEPIDTNSSFQSKVRFRLPFETISDGLSLWIGPEDKPNGENQLTLKIDPILPGESNQSNKLLLVTPGQGSDSENASFGLNGRDPIAAWVDYDSSTNQYQVFINDSDSKPETPFFSRTIDLSELGDRAFFGFSAAGSNNGQYADLLSWQLDTTEPFASSLTDSPLTTTVATEAIAPAALFAMASTELETLESPSLLFAESETAPASTPEPRLLMALGLLASTLLLTKQQSKNKAQKR